MQAKRARRARRAKRARARLHGTAERPRLSVFRSAKHFSAQLIDDNAGRTLAHVADAKDMKGTKTEVSTTLGAMMAEKAKALNISTIVFDRG